MGTISVQWVTDALGKPDWAALLGAAWRIGGHAMSHVYGQRLVKKKNTICVAQAPSGATSSLFFIHVIHCHLRLQTPKPPRLQARRALELALQAQTGEGGSRGMTPEAIIIL